MTRSEKYIKAFQDYKDQFCNSEGNQRSNLNHTQRQGLKKIKERIKTGEVIICKTDKSDKLAAVSTDIYRELGKAHIKQDKQIEHRKIQRTLNAHT